MMSNHLQHLAHCLTLTSSHRMFPCRAGAGVGSDQVSVRRGHFLVGAGVAFALTYGTLAVHTSAATLSAAAAVLGGSYGALWSVLPTVTSELFGTESFGTNWGYLILAPGEMPATISRHTHSNQPPGGNPCAVSHACKYMLLTPSTRSLSIL